MNVAVLVVLVVFIEIALHDFRWREVLLGRELPRPVAYALGVLGMMGPFTAWLLQKGETETALVLWLVIAAAGGSVLVCYAIDWVTNLLWIARESGQREQAALTGLKDAIDAKK
jgi:hypothetical protein